MRLCFSPLWVSTLAVSLLLAPLLVDAQTTTPAPATTPAAAPATTSRPPTATTSASSPASTSSPASASAFTSTQCPGTQVDFGQGAGCNCTILTPATILAQGACPAGFYCPEPGVQFPCTDGFYCPKNTFQPDFCCGGYYCPTPDTIFGCPEGYVCLQGSKIQKKCYLGFCPAGSHTETKIAVVVVFFVFLVVIWAAFGIKNRLQHSKQVKYQGRIQAIKNAPAFMRKGTKLVSSSKVFDISFEALGLTLPNGVSIMKNVTGELRAGKSCAVMGPSGAGKTTFISLLTGKAKRTSGHVFINGKPGRLEDQRKLIGFVPQEDVMLRELTVRDILTHSAMTRLPLDWTLKRKKEKVLQTIEYLGLAHVMDSIIGDEETRGVSGGQRKRVNIGMELVAEPSILFLDEPTSGLDSATSLEVCTLLSRIARYQRLTVAAIIHSPSPQAFARFDDLLLLGKGGQIVYHGPRATAPDYFASIGFPVPDGVNEADFYLDISSGKVERQGYPGSFHPVELFDMWQAHRRQGGLSQQYQSDGKMQPFDSVGAEDGPHFHHDGASAERGEPEVVKPDGFLTTIKHWIHDTGSYWADIFREIGISFLECFGICLRRRDPVRDSPGFFSLFILCFKRSFYQIYRSPSSFIGDQLLHLGCGLFISIAAQKSVYLPPLPGPVCAASPAAMQEQCALPQSDVLRQVGQFIAWGIGFAGIAVGSGTFGNERVVAWRERSTGIPLFPYFLAKSLADLPRAAIAAAMFLLSFTLSFNSSQAYVTLYLVVLSLYFVGFSSGYFVSAIVSRQKAALVGVVFALVWAIAFSGVEPRIRMIREEYGWLGWLFGISAPRWAISAFYLKESHREGYTEFNDSAVIYYGYDTDDYGRDVAYVFIIGIMWQAIAFVCMKMLHREKQK